MGVSDIWQVRKWMSHEKKSSISHIKNNPSNVVNIFILHVHISQMCDICPSIYVSNISIVFKILLVTF